jgi:hypothetical protein
LRSKWEKEVYAYNYIQEKPEEENRSPEIEGDSEKGEQAICPSA